jgi:hypothetical protein
MNLKFNCGRDTFIEILYGVLRFRSSYFMGTYIGGVQILYEKHCIPFPFGLLPFFGFSFLSVNVKK